MKLIVRQRHELGEWVGFETRNRYEVQTEDGVPYAYAAEQQKGVLGFLLRQGLGHWRSFEILFFSPARELMMIARHPFRWIFQRLEVSDASGAPVGAIQQRFAILQKRFDVEGPGGEVLMTVSSPLLRFWTFPFVKNGAQVACVSKKWSGFLSEAFTDRDSFLVEADPEALSEAERGLVLAAALFVDLIYFERKA